MLHTENCSECQMALQTNHFVHWTFRGFNWNPTWWEAVSLWSVSSLTKQANIFKVNEHFLKCIVLKFIHLEQIGSESIVKRLRIGYETVGNIKVVSTDSFKQPEVANKVD